MKKMQICYTSKENTSSKEEDTSLENKEKLSKKLIHREIKDCAGIRHSEVSTEKYGHRNSNVFQNKIPCEEIQKTSISEMVTHYIERINTNNLQLFKNRGLAVKEVETDKVLIPDENIDISQHKISPMKREVLLDLVRTVKVEPSEEGEESEKAQIVNNDKTDDDDDDDSSVGSLVMDCDDDSFDDTKEHSPDEAEDNSLVKCTTADIPINNLTNKNDDKGKTGDSDTSFTPVFKCGHCSDFSLNIQVIASHKCKPKDQVNDSIVRLKKMLEKLKQTTRIKLIFTFGCEFCGRLFLRRRNYRQHLRRVHQKYCSDKPFASTHTNTPRIVQRNCETILNSGVLTGSVNCHSQSNICRSDTDQLNSFGGENSAGNTAVTTTQPSHTVSTNLNSYGSIREGSSHLNGAIKVSINGEEMYKCSSCDKLLSSITNYWRHVYSLVCAKNQEKKKASGEGQKRRCARKNKNPSSIDLDVTSSSSSCSQNATDNTRTNLQALLESSSRPLGVEHRFNEANVTSLLKECRNRRNQNNCITLDTDEVLEDNGGESKMGGEQEEKSNISLAILAVQGNYEGHEVSLAPNFIEPEAGSVYSEGRQADSDAEEEDVDIEVLSDSEVLKKETETCITIDDSESSQDSYPPTVHLESDNEECTEEAEVDALEMDCTETVDDNSNSSTGDSRSNMMYELHTVMIDEDEAESAKSVSEVEDVDPLAICHEGKVKEMLSKEIKGNEYPQEVMAESEREEIMQNKIPIAVNRTVSLPCRGVNTQTMQVASLTSNAVNGKFLQSNTAPGNITNASPMFRMVIPNESSGNSLVLQQQTVTSGTTCYKIVPTVRGTGSLPSSPLYLCHKCNFATTKQSVFLSHVCATPIIQQNVSHRVLPLTVGSRLLQCLKCGGINLYNDEKSFASHICCPDSSRKDTFPNSKSAKVAASSKKRSTPAKDASSSSDNASVVASSSVTRTGSVPSSPLYLCHKCNFATTKQSVFLSHVCATPIIQQNESHRVLPLTVGSRLLQCLKCGGINLYNDEKSFASHICSTDSSRKDTFPNSKSAKVAAISKKRSTPTKDTSSSSDNASVVASSSPSVTPPNKNKISVINHERLIAVSNTDTLSPNAPISNASSSTKRLKVRDLVKIAPAAPPSKTVTSDDINCVKPCTITIWKCLRCNYVTRIKRQFASHSCSKRLTGLFKIAPKASKPSVHRQANVKQVMAVMQEEVEPPVWGCTKCSFTSRNRQAYLLHRCSAVSRRAAKDGTGSRAALPTGDHSAATIMVCPGCGFMTDGRLTFALHKCPYTKGVQVRKGVPLYLSP